MSSLSLALLSMPPKGGPSLIGPDGDMYYAVFVGFVLVALVIGSFLFYRYSEIDRRRIEAQERQAAHADPAVPPVQGPT